MVIGIAVTCAIDCPVGSDPLRWQTRRARVDPAARVSRVVRSYPSDGRGGHIEVAASVIIPTSAVGGDSDAGGDVVGRLLFRTPYELGWADAITELEVRISDPRHIPALDDVVAELSPRCHRHARLNKRCHGSLRTSPGLTTRRTSVTTRRAHRGTTNPASRSRESCEGRRLCGGRRMSRRFDEKPKAGTRRGGCTWPIRAMRGGTR